jgi:hypothetical protein
VENQRASSKDDVSCHPSDNQNVLHPPSPASIPGFGSPATQTTQLTIDNSSSRSISPSDELIRMFLKKSGCSNGLAARGAAVYKYNHFLPTKKQIHKKRQPKL